MGLPIEPFGDILNGMATPGELVKVVAAATGTDLATVTHHDRNLVTAGLRTKGGRGTSAAKVTPRDGAHLLTAVLGSEHIKDSAETVLRYADTLEYVDYLLLHSPQYKREHRAFEVTKVPALEALPPGHSFIDTLTTLIEMVTDDRYPLEIGTEPLTCTIEVGYPQTEARLRLHSDPKRTSVQANYSRHRYPGGRPPKAPKERNGPIRRYSVMYAPPIWYVGALLGDRLHKLPKLEGLS